MRVCVRVFVRVCVRVFVSVSVGHCRRQGHGRRRHGGQRHGRQTPRTRISARTLPLLLPFLLGLGLVVGHVGLHTRFEGDSPGVDDSDLQVGLVAALLLLLVLLLRTLLSLLSILLLSILLLFILLVHRLLCVLGQQVRGHGIDDRRKGRVHCGNVE